MNSTNIEELQKRFTECSRKKAHLELMNRMLTELTEVSGLDETVSHIISILMNTIGSANIAIYYKLNEQIHYQDVYGEGVTLDIIEDPQILQVIERSAPIRIHNDSNRSLQLSRTGLGNTENWYFPLIARGKTIGVVALIGMQLLDDAIWNEISPFFKYAALMLDNEINNYQQLLVSYKQTMESEERLRTLFNESPFGVVLVDPETAEITHFNRAARLALGYDSEEFSRLKVTDFETIDDFAKIRKRAELLQSEGSTVFETIHRTKHGELRNVLINLKEITVAGKRMVQSIYQDITETKRSRGLLELYRHALDNARDEVFLVDRNASFIFVNDSACNTLGYSKEELWGMTVFDIDPNFPPSIWDEHWSELERRNSFTIETTHRAKNGDEIPVEISLQYFQYEKAEYTLSVARDITDRKKQEAEKLQMERKLLHSQKLESLGVMAGGIAHDFNNLLAAIMGNLDLSLIRLPDHSPASKNIENALQACQRAADLTRQMLAYTGKGTFETQTINLSDFVERNAELLRTSIPRTTTLFLDLPHSEECSIKGDSGQIQQIVMNLITNAAEAIGQNPGAITITSGCNIFSDEELSYSLIEKKAPAGKFVWLRVKDNGCGMDKKTISRIFEPFFTTKFTGRGLGMSAVLGIISSHNGAITLKSELGKGSEFTVLFPAVEKELPKETHTPETLQGKGNGMILIADDEEMIIDFCADAITAVGFTPIKACNGIEAVEKFRKYEETISLTILDITMPKMDGVAAFYAIKKIKPDAAVVVSSGYGEQNISSQFTGIKPDAFIQKPYSIKALHETIKNCLKV